MSVGSVSVVKGNDNRPDGMKRDGRCCIEPSCVELEVEREAACLEMAILLVRCSLDEIRLGRMQASHRSEWT